jgi:ubiquitin C-terminal hydrolase
MVQIKRFDWDGSKLSTHVDIDPILDLSRYRAPGNHECLRYDLTAVVKHSGTISSGHYICAASGPDSLWNTFDDQVVLKTTVNSAVTKSRFTPYLMFFKRKTD